MHSTACDQILRPVFMRYLVTPISNSLHFAADTQLTLFQSSLPITQGFKFLRDAVFELLKGLLDPQFLQVLLGKLQKTQVLLQS